MALVNLIFPIFLIIFLGYVLKKTEFITLNFGRELNKFVFYIALPVLLFQKTSKIDLSQFISIELIAAYPICVAAIVLLSYFHGRNFEARQRGAFLQGCFRPNLTYLGMPIVLTALGERALGYVAVVIVTGVVVNAALAVVILRLLDEQLEDASLINKIVGVIKNPLIISIALGIAFSYSGLNLPAALENVIKIIAPISLGLILITIGISLNFSEMRKFLKLELVAGVYKLVLMPLIGYLVMAKVFQISGMPLYTLTIMLGMPTAIVSYTFAKELNSDAPLALSIVSFNTLAGMFTIPLIILVLGC